TDLVLCAQTCFIQVNDYLREFTAEIHRLFTREDRCFVSLPHFPLCARQQWDKTRDAWRRRRAFFCAREFVRRNCGKFRGARSLPTAQLAGLTGALRASLAVSAAPHGCAGSPDTGRRR